MKRKAEIAIYMGFRRGLVTAMRLVDADHSATASASG
jgi:hypothetical protein